MKVNDPVRRLSVEEIVRSCDRRGFTGNKTAKVLQSHGYESPSGKAFSRQWISQLRLRMADSGNRIIIDSERLEDQIRLNATLLRLAGASDPRAEKLYLAYEDELLETGSPLLAFDAAKREAVSQRRERRAAIEVEAEAEVVAVSLMEVHSNGVGS